MALLWSDYQPKQKMSSAAYLNLNLQLVAMVNVLFQPSGVVPQTYQTIISLCSEMLQRGCAFGKRIRTLKLERYSQTYKANFKSKTKT
jgi:hypothetical protein